VLYKYAALPFTLKIFVESGIQEEVVPAKSKTAKFKTTSVSNLQGGGQSQIVKYLKDKVEAAQSNRDASHKKNANPDGPRPSLSVTIVGGVVLGNLDNTEVFINMSDLTFVPRWIEATNSLIKGSKKETLQFSANDTATVSRYGICGGDRIIFRVKKNVFLF